MAGSRKDSGTFLPHNILSMLIDTIIGLLNNNCTTNLHYSYLIHLFTSEAKLIIRLFLKIRN
jgi:hypothetical protein